MAEKVEVKVEHKQGECNNKRAPSFSDQDDHHEEEAEEEEEFLLMK